LLLAMILRLDTQLTGFFLPGLAQNRRLAENSSLLHQTIEIHNGGVDKTATVLSLGLSI